MRKEVWQMDGYQIGDHVVFRRNQAAADPGHGADSVPPSPVDDTPRPRSRVDEYWTVRAVNGDGTIDVTNAEGKIFRLKSSSPGLCKASFFAELLHGRQFPVVWGMR